MGFATITEDLAASGVPGILMRPGLARLFTEGGGGITTGCCLESCKIVPFVRRHCNAHHVTAMGKSVPSVITSRMIVMAHSASDSCVLVAMFGWLKCPRQPTAPLQSYPLTSAVARIVVGVRKQQKRLLRETILRSRFEDMEDIRMEGGECTGRHDVRNERRSKPIVHHLKPIRC
jgi:hypothetical protein